MGTSFMPIEFVMGSEVLPNPSRRPRKTVALMTKGRVFCIRFGARSHSYLPFSGRLISIFSFEIGPTSFLESTSSSEKRARRISPSVLRL